MNSIQLEYFVSVAECGSFTAASGKLHLSQPALSKQIRLLEEELGTALLIRLPRGIRMTPEGKLLLARSGEILTLMKQIPAELDEMHHTASGELNIVCGPFFSRQIMPDLLKRLLVRFPGICPRIREVIGNVQDDLLVSGAADVGIGTMRRGNPRLTFLPVFQSDLVLIRSVHSPLRGRKKITIKDLAEQKLICYSPGTVLHDVVMQIFEPYSPCILMDSHSSTTIIELVRENMGIAFVPDYLIDPERRNGITTGGYDSGKHVTVCCKYSSERRLTPQTKAFLQIVREKYALSDL